MFKIKSVKSKKAKSVKSSSIESDDTKIQHGNNNSKSKNGSCPLDPLPCDPCSLTSPFNPIYWLGGLCLGITLVGNALNIFCCCERLCGSDDCCDHYCCEDNC